MPKIKIGIVVDGSTETEALKNCLNRTQHDFIIRKNNLNGKTVSLNNIAASCAKLLAAISQTGTVQNIVIVDREGRDTISATDMKVQLETMIQVHFKGQFSVFVPDRMFENWIVADLDNLKHLHSDLIIQTAKSDAVNEGRNGTRVLKDNWNSGSAYKKLLHGPQLFHSVDKKLARAHSASLDIFVDFLTKSGIHLH